MNPELLKLLAEAGGIVVVVWLFLRHGKTALERITTSNEKVNENIVEELREVRQVLYSKLNGKEKD
jgi:hypothetical protein